MTSCAYFKVKTLMMPVCFCIYLIQVVADNDAPHVSGPASFSGSENLWFPLHELSVLDLDAVDRLTPNETVLSKRTCAAFPSHPFHCLSTLRD